MVNLKEYIFERLKLTKDTVITKSDPKDPSTWQEGDILCGTWGYSMVIPEWYQIVKRTAKQLTLQEIPEKIVSGHYNGQWESMPDLEKAKQKPGKEIKARINKWNSVTVDGKVYVHLWDGKTPLHGDDMD